MLLRLAIDAGENVIDSSLVHQRFLQSLRFLTGMLGNQQAPYITARQKMPFRNELPSQAHGHDNCVLHDVDIYPSRYSWNGDTWAGYG